MVPFQQARPILTKPNDSSTQAALLTLGTSIQAYISSPTDVDWFKVNVTSFGTLQLSLSVPAGKDFDLELYGPNGAWLAGSYNPAGYAESIQQTVTTPGTYYFRVYGYPLGAGDYSPSSAYTLSSSFAPQTSTITTSGAVTTATWSGVVNLTGDVTIGAGSALTILPGTVIQCAADSDSSSRRCQSKPGGDHFEWRDAQCHRHFWLSDIVHVQRSDQDAWGLVWDTGDGGGRDDQQLRGGVCGGRDTV